MSRTYIIAEAGVNHNGDLDKAFMLVEKAKDIGADAVKFQMFNAENLVTQAAEQADYQKKSAQGYENQYAMLKALELSSDSFKLLADKAKQLSIDFIVTPFCLNSLNVLIDEFETPYIKISSGDITHGPLLLAAAKAGKKIILSTGMSLLTEVEQALKILAFGYCSSESYPTSKELNKVFAQSNTWDVLKKNVTILHCTSEYPAPYEEINLKAMDTLRSAFGLSVGLSDHSPGITVSLAAAAREACMLEKHFTLDKNLPGPDHKASLDVDEFKALVIGVRQIEKALGHDRKIITSSESNNQSLVRRSIVAKHDINKNDLYSDNNLSFKRPATGRSPMHYWDLIGQEANKTYLVNEVIE